MFTWQWTQWLCWKHARGEDPGHSHNGGNHGRRDTSDPALAPGSLSKSRPVGRFVSRRWTEGKHSYSERSVSYVSETDNKTETLQILKPQNASSAKRSRNMTNHHPDGSENDFRSPPWTIWYQFWKPHFPWGTELYNILCVHNIMNILNGRKAITVLEISWPDSIHLSEWIP